MHRRRLAATVSLATLITAIIGAWTAPRSASADDAGLRDAVHAWRQSHEHEIVRELVALLALPNVAADAEAIERNVEHLVPMFERRGFRTQVLRAGKARPAVFAELPAPGAELTVVVYCHYDGQPVDPRLWTDDPWTPVLRLPADSLGTDSDGEKKPQVVTTPWPTPLDPEARIYGRSASDDKGPIVAILAAIDALHATGRELSVNLKIFLEGEEEAGSPHLRQLLSAHRELLEADVWLLADGPVHPSRRQQVVFGARGVTGVELTLFGPARPLHSGHYGNWAPNPAAQLAHLIAGLRDGDGTVTITGFYDDIRPLNTAELNAARSMPAVEEDLMQELAIAWTEGSAASLQELVMRPALNVKGLASAEVGDKAKNAIPTEARASIGFRLVPDQSPETVRERFEAHLANAGYAIVHSVPDLETRSKHAKLVQLDWQPGYAGARTPIDLPVSQAVLRIVDEAVSGGVIPVPNLGGSVPIALFVESLDVPVIIVPMVNHDNNQHAADENLRLANLWSGIEVYAQLFARLGEAW